MIILAESPSALQLAGVAQVLAGVIVAARRTRSAAEGPAQAGAVTEPAG